MFPVVRSLLLTVSAVCVLITSQAYGDVCRGCQVDRERVLPAYDQLLNLSANAKRRSERVHLPWGVPTEPAGASNERLLHQEEYIICYDDDLRVPLWVAHRLTAADLAISRPRTECFRSDPRLPEQAAAVCEDFEEEPEATDRYDRGHLARSNDFSRSEAAMINTYILSNICPQFGEFNRRGKPWNVLENVVQDWATSAGEIYVISGAIFDRNGDGQRDADQAAPRIRPTNRVAIPSHFFKIVIRVRSNGFIESFAIILPHKKTWQGRVMEYLERDTNLCSISEIEQVTDIDFLPFMPEPQKSAIKAFEAASLDPPSVEDRDGRRRDAGPIFEFAPRRPEISNLRSAFGTGTKAEPREVLESLTVKTPAAGRYQALPGSGSRKFILVDTSTGRAWERVTSPEGDKWIEIPPPK